MQRSLVSDSFATCRKNSHGPVVHIFLPCIAISCNITSYHSFGWTCCMYEGPDLVPSPQPLATSQRPRRRCMGRLGKATLPWSRSCCLQKPRWTPVASKAMASELSCTEEPCGEGAKVQLINLQILELEAPLGATGASIL